MYARTFCRYDATTVSMTIATTSPIAGEKEYADNPATLSVRKISSGAYATDDNASLANTGNAIRFGSSVSPSRSLRTGRPTSRRLDSEARLGTGRSYGRRLTVTAQGARRAPVTRVASDVVHYVIMGCGRVGSMLARGLEKLGHSVAVVDRDPVAFRRLGADFRGTTVTGIGFDRDTLVEAGIENADALAAVSSGDNSNIITARVARETFGVHHVVARIYDPKRAEVYERLGIPTVATVRWTAGRMLRALLDEGTDELWRDPTSNVAIVEVRPDERWVGRLLADYERTIGARAAYVTRFGVGTLPTASMVVQDGDRICVLVDNQTAKAVTAAATVGPESAG